MKKSAGILLYRLGNTGIEIFLVHPGGPFFKNKDLGSWTIPKGEFEDDEEPLKAALREFNEETGHLPEGNFIELKPVKQKSGKIVYAWAIEGNIDEKDLKCNVFSLEWPPRSGKFNEFPEVDEGKWFNADTALKKIIPAQASFINELVAKSET